MLSRLCSADASRWVFVESVVWGVLILYPGFLPSLARDIWSPDSCTHYLWMDHQPVLQEQSGARKSWHVGSGLEQSQCLAPKTFLPGDQCGRASSWSTLGQEENVTEVVSSLKGLVSLPLLGDGEDLSHSFLLLYASPAWSWHWGLFILMPVPDASGTVDHCWFWKSQYPHPLIPGWEGGGRGHHYSSDLESSHTPLCVILH